MIFLKKAWKKLTARISESPRLSVLKRIISGLLFFLILTFILSFDMFPQKVNFEEGQVSDQDIFASQSISFVDEQKTEEARAQAAAAVEDVYVINEYAVESISENINAAIDKTVEIVSNQQLTAAEKTDRIKTNLTVELTNSTAAKIAQTEREDLLELKTILNTLVEDIMETEITDDNLSSAKQQLKEKTADYKLSAGCTEFAAVLIDQYLESNKYYDAKATEAAREQAEKEVEAVQISIKKGQKIIGNGDIVSEDHLKKLEALGLMKAKMPLTEIIGLSILVIIGMIVVLVYLNHYYRDIYFKGNYLMLLGIIVIIVLVISKTLIAVDTNRWQDFAGMLGYMAPIAAASMMITILVSSDLAILVTAILALVVSIMTSNQINYAAVALIGGIVGVFCVSNLSQRGDLIKAGIFVGLADMLVILSFGLTNGLSLQLIIMSSLFFGGINGILTSVLTIGILPYLESMFGITSSIKLLELSDPSHPLLKKLLLEAPGTYHHSVVVGNLAEAATDVTGGNSLVVRVGAYYHDIGKIKRPYFFIENQISDENPHDKISPDLSALILTSHTRDGVELAEQYNLPQVIVDMIRQHHGTSLAGYFYNKALKQGTEAEENDFRYDGPKPQSKEAAIIMLADSVEAAVRSLKSPSIDAIEEMVDKIFKDKLADGQLDDAEITMKELTEINHAFLRVLSGIYHKRIEYPEQVTQDKMMLEMKGSE